MAICFTNAARGDSGPRLGDAEFFGMLDLARPELGAVRSAAEKHDWPAAKHELAAYMRARKTPRWNPEAGRPGRARRGGATRADDALAHRFTSVGIPVQFGSNINWLFNPTAEPGSKWPVNHEWTWQFNRHSFWLALGNAYAHTGDEKYAAEFTAQLRSWIRDCPVPVDAPANKPFSAWRTIEAGIRMQNSWPGVFFAMLNSKSFDDDAVVLMMKSFVEHAQYLMKFQTSGNWLATEANGLYHVGSLFPEFRDARLWRESALRIMTREIDAQVYPDGAQIELAPGYHAVTLGDFLGPVELAASTGIEPPPDYLARLEPMFDYFLYSMQPTRQTPPLNDSGAGEVRRWMTLGAKLYPGRDDFKWFASDGREGKPPAEASHEFPYAGWFVMRSGWQSDALWLLMDAGPFGFKHQHEDKLNIILTAYGRPLLVEAGVYTYDASQWRRYVLGSRAHNVVLVDGLEQNRERSPRSSYVVSKPLPHEWKSTDQYDYAAGYYEEGWGPDAARIATQTRRVWFFKKEGCFVVMDEFDPKGLAKHQYEALFHLDADEATSEGLIISTKNEGPNLTILADGPDSVRIVKGETSPIVQGWMCGSSSYSGLRAIPTAIYQTKARGKARMVYLLYPTPAGKQCPVRAIETGRKTVTLLMRDGATKKLELKR